MSEAHALAGRVGGLTTAARHGGRKTAAPARAGFMAKFEREVDPDGVLTPEERKRRAELARRAHMTRLAIKSAQARRKSSVSAQSASSSESTGAPGGTGGAGRGATDVSRGSGTSVALAPKSKSNQRPADEAGRRSGRAAGSARKAG